MVLINDTRQGAIRTRIEASGPALFVFRAKERNQILRASMEAPGWTQIAKFLPLRFTPYVWRAPFSYPKHSAKKAAALMRRAAYGTELQTIWTRIKSREFFNWDPWSSAPAPEALVKKFLAERPGYYKTYTRGNRNRADLTKSARREMYADLRRWAKKRTLHYTENFADDEHVLPLVESGDLRKAALEGARVKGVSTKKKTRVTITIPRLNRQNRRVISILGRMPNWEFAAFVRGFEGALQENLRAATVAKASLPPKPARPRKPRRNVQIDGYQPVRGLW